MAEGMFLLYKQVWVPLVKAYSWKVEGTWGNQSKEIIQCSISVIYNFSNEAVCITTLQRRDDSFPEALHLPGWQREWTWVTGAPDP